MIPVIKYSLAFLILVCLSFSACSLVHYKVYFRNLSDTPALLTLLYTPDLSDSLDTIGVKYSNAILDINRKTYKKLEQVAFPAMAGPNQIILTIPPGTTFFLSELLDATRQVSENTLIIEHGARRDTIPFNYPYRGIGGMKRKPDPTYNYMYWSIIYYDLP